MLNTQMKNLSILILAFSAFSASAAETKLECRIFGTMHGPDFTIKDDGTMSVSAGGWSTSVLLKDSPITFVNGKVSVQESIAFEGEEPQVTLTENEVVRISEASGRYVLLLDKKGRPAREEGQSSFSGYLLKGGLGITIPGESETEKKENDAILCYGKSDALEFKQ